MPQSERICGCFLYLAAFTCCVCSSDPNLEKDLEGARERHVCGVTHPAFINPLHKKDEMFLMKKQQLCIPLPQQSPWRRHASPWHLTSKKWQVPVPAPRKGQNSAQYQMLGHWVCLLSTGPLGIVSVQPFPVHEGFGTTKDILVGTEASCSHNVKSMWSGVIGTTPTVNWRLKISSGLYPVN